MIYLWILTKRYCCFLDTADDRVSVVSRKDYKYIIERVNLKNISNRVLFRDCQYKDICNQNCNFLTDTLDKFLCDIFVCNFSWSDEKFCYLNVYKTRIYDKRCIELGKLIFLKMFSSYQSMIAYKDDKFICIKAYEFKNREEKHTDKGKSNKVLENSFKRIVTYWRGINNFFNTDYCFDVLSMNIDDIILFANSLIDDSSNTISAQDILSLYFKRNIGKKILEFKFDTLVIDDDKVILKLNSIVNRMKKGLKG